MAPRNTRVNPETETRSPARSFARTLDNYYAPARDRRSEQAFQEGLAGFSNILQEKANRTKELQRKDEYSQGQADAMREAAGEELKGVRTGSIFRQNSSYYMAGLNEQRGKAKGIEFRSKMAREYQAWEGKNSDDPNDFRNFMNQRSGEFIESLQGNPQMLNAALPYINEVASNTAASHTAYTNERLQEEQIEASHQVFGDIVAGYARGDYDQLDAVNALAREVEELYASGEKDARGILVDAMILEAGANDSLYPLEVIAVAYDQGKIKLSKAQKDRLDTASDRLEAEIRRQDAQRSEDEREEYDAMINGYVNTFTDALMKNPRLDARKYYTSLQISDENLFTKLNTVQKAVQSAAKNSGPTDASTRLAFQGELLAAEGNVQERNRVLAKYAAAGALTKSDVDSFLQDNMDIANGTSVYDSEHIQNLKDGYIGGISVIESDGFDVDKSGAAQQFAETRYITLMNQEMRGVDPNDYNAIDQAHAKVVERVNRETLAKHKDFRSDVGSGNENKQGALDSTGMGQTLADAEAAQAKREAEQARKEMQMSQQLAEEDAAMSQEVVDSPEVEPEEDAPLNRRGRREAGNPNPDADQTFMEGVSEFFNPSNPEVGRQAAKRQGKVQQGSIEELTMEPEDQSEETRSFYEQILNTFTDGEYTGTTLETAVEVLDNDPEFKTGVQQLADKYEVPAAALLAVMDFETGGTFNPAEKNKAGSGATGIIQFMPNTARGLGTSTAALAQMTRVEQLVYVEKYFDQYRNKIRGGSVDDLYMAVLWPAAVGKPDGYVLFRRTSSNPKSAYNQNRGLDRNGDGTITKAEAATKVKAKFYGY